MASVTATPRARRVVVRVQRAVATPVATFAQLGSFLQFSGQAMRALVGQVLLRRRFLPEVGRQVSDIVVGTGAVVVGGGMVFVIGAMSMATGATVGIQGYEGLRSLGAESLTGLVTSFGNVREVTPIIAGIALAAQVGSSFTAELGAKRISEEIDALEVMSIPPIAYLVSTRILGALIAIIPLYLISLFASFFAAQFVTTQLLGLSQGVYDYYFRLFLPPIDVLYSLIKALVFAVLVVLIHCWYGYNASGGPEGVGVAVGKAIRTSIVVIVIVNLFLSYVFWGTSTTVSLTG
jgi:phospholipid/cholesterol/gamma-HCH transport system permease protein